MFIVPGSLGVEGKRKRTRFAMHTAPGQHVMVVIRTARSVESGVCEI